MFLTVSPYNRSGELAQGFWVLQSLPDLQDLIASTRVIAAPFYACLLSPHPHPPIPSNMHATGGNRLTWAFAHLPDGTGQLHLWLDGWDEDVALFTCWCGVRRERRRGPGEMRNSVHAEQTSSPYPLFTAAAGLPGVSVGHHHANLSLCPELQPKLLKCMFIKKKICHSVRRSGAATNYMNRSQTSHHSFTWPSMESMSGVNTSLTIRQMIDRWMLTTVMVLMISVAMENRIQQWKKEDWSHRRGWEKRPGKPFVGLELQRNEEVGWKRQREEKGGA